MHWLANALVQRGHVVTCYSFSPRPGNALYNHVRFQAKGSGSPLFAKFLPALVFRRIATDSYDIVHFHGDDYFCFSYAHSVRTFYGSAFYEALFAHSYQRALYQGLFFLFEIWSSLLRRKNIGISHKSARPIPGISHIIPCGIPLTLFKEAHASKSPHPSLLFLGDLNSRKQGHILLDLFQQHILPHHPDAILTVIGPEAVDAPNVVYRGHVNRTHLLYIWNESWIYCMTSSWEGFGVPVLEAMASNTAVVALRNQGIDALCTHDHNALLSTTVEEFSRMLTDCLSQPSLRQRLTAAGAETVSQYDISRTAHAYEMVYRQLQRAENTRKRMCRSSHT